MQLGIDVGSTTVKLVMLDGSQIKYKEYRRHQSDVFNAAIKMLGELIQQVGDIDVNVVITGSGGLGMAGYGCEVRAGGNRLYQGHRRDNPANGCGDRAWG